MTKIIVNGVEVEADPKKPIIAACHGNGVEVPHYCYHPGLEPVGSCRICQVEVQQGTMPARVMVACRTYPAEGMVINTESQKAHDTRRECLEFLLKNHPLDCPICDKAGECDLQDYTYQEGQDEGRSNEPRRHLEKRKSLGDVIVLDEERCILCSRCVRFFEEVPRKAQLTVSNLGSRSVISTFGDKPLTGNYQGNIADLCPVGALTLKNFRFQARVWNLLKMASTCAECSRGCSTTVEVLRNSDVKRFRPRENPAVNRWWMCDTGRFAYAHPNQSNRLSGALVKGSPAGAQAGIEALAGAMRSSGKVAIVASPWCTIEEAALIQQLASALGTKACFFSPEPNNLKDDLLHTGDPCPNRRGLSEAGLVAVKRSELAGAVAGAQLVVLIGERIGELVGDALSATSALAILDTVAPAQANCAIAIGVPNYAERTGTWISIDGHRGPISAAKASPHGVAPLTRTLQDLHSGLGAALQRS